MDDTCISPILDWTILSMLVLFAIYAGANRNWLYVAALAIAIGVGLAQQLKRD